MIVYVSIGNSDDKLTQESWADFIEAVDDNLPIKRHGVWFSAATSRLTPSRPCSSRATSPPSPKSSGRTPSRGLKSRQPSSLAPAMRRRCCQYCGDPLKWWTAPLRFIVTCGNCAYRMSMGTSPRRRPPTTEETKP